MGQGRQVINDVLIKAKRLVDDDAILTGAEAKSVRRGEAQFKCGQFKSWAAVKNHFHDTHRQAEAGLKPGAG